jgi:sugar lactone lactonase YvrE
MPYEKTHVIGGRFHTALRGIAVDRRNHLYAAGDSDVKVFNPDGELLLGWATAKPGHSIAIAGDGSVYVGEEGQVEIFDGAGHPTNVWRDAEKLGRVTAIGFVKGTVLLGDAKDRCIRRYDASGKFLNNIGKDNRMEGFLIPNGVVEFSVDACGTIHVTNPGKHRVERYTPWDELLGHFGRFDGLDPGGFQGCCNPTNVAVTGCDRIYVTEKAGPRVKVYDFNGKLISVIAEEVFDPNCKNMDIAVDGRGRVYVVDTVKFQILAFAPMA